MTDDRIMTALAATDVRTANPYYAVQGLRASRAADCNRMGHWRTLFAPYQSATDAIAMRDYLQRKNPNCQYKAIRVETLLN